MTRSCLNISVLLLAFLATGTAQTRQPPSAWRVGLRSFGPVRYGMTLAEASRALGEHLEPGKEESEGCSHITPTSIPPGATLMVIHGRIERVDIDTTGILTASGVQVGSTEEEVHRAYPGQIRVRPHPDEPGPEWHYLIFVPRNPADSAFGIIFETDGHRVQTYRAGRRPAISYIEGCA